MHISLHVQGGINSSYGDYLMFFLKYSAYTREILSSTISRRAYHQLSRLRMLEGKYKILADNSSIEKPLLDDRSYRFIKLNSNGLHALVIQDPQTDKSAAALDVHVGSFADKKFQIPGLAHFCEHLLFMGTKKYPEENGYSSYLSEHSGYSNAYTASEHTNYYFEVSADYLEGALDRFAQFFIEPLFSVSCKDREIKAVDSENKKNLQNDLWRFYQLDKLSSNPNHPYNGFSTGNYNTLHTEPVSRGLNVRDVLLDFYNSHYSSSIMSLVILGKEDLDTLTSWAIEKFSDVPQKEATRPNYNGELIYTPDQMKTMIKAKPIMDTHKMELTFLIPDDQEAKWKTRPAGYFSHLLGHEGDGSLLQYLKSKSWVNELSAGSMKVCQGNSVLAVELDLTPEGLNNWDHVLVNIFEYLKMISLEEPKEWLWNELQNMSKINFKFRQKQRAASTVSKMSNTLYKFTEDAFIPLDYILSSLVLREFSAKEIKEYTNYLNANNFRLMLSSRKLDGLNEKEKWYGTEYSYENLPNNVADRINSVGTNPHLHFPVQNKFIPEDFTVLKSKSDSPLIHPYLIEENEKFQIWFKQDDQFEVPRGAIVMFLHLPGTNHSAKNSVHSTLLGELIDDELNNIVYYASLAGLSFSIDHLRDGLMIKVNGFNDKLSVLLEKILHTVVKFEPKKDRYEVIKHKLAQDLRNAGYEVPYSQIGNHFLTLVNCDTYTYDEKVEILEKQSNFDDFNKFVNSLLRDSSIFSEVLIQGNFDVTKAREISYNVEKIFSPYSSISDSTEERMLKLRSKSYYVPPGETIRHEVELKDEDNVNSCIEYFIQVDKSLENKKLRVLTDLLSTIIQEPCFNQLRTKEQLGYVVFSGTRVTRTTLGFRVLIQSEKSTAYLEYRIKEFLENFSKFVNSKLTDEGFTRFKQALKDKKLQKLKNLGEEVNKFWSAINSGYYDFEEKETHVEILENIGKAEFLEFFNKYILPDSNSSGRIIIHLQSRKVPPLDKQKIVHLSVHNFLYRSNFDLPSDILDKAISDNYDNLTALAPEVAGLIVKTYPDQDADKLQANLLEAINRDIQSPVPEGFPSGSKYSLEAFKSTFDTTGIPVPVKPLSTYYGPKTIEDQAHL